MELILASPRGFCAGVERAVLVVEEALRRFTPPVYVRHEIVHNKVVVRRLAQLGARFVEELSEVPDGAPVIFSAHGVASAIYAEAAQRQLHFIDATCPLVRKVHFAVKRHAKRRARIILIGHRGHPEVIGTMGQIPTGEVFLVEKVTDIATLPEDCSNTPLVYTTQTTLSVLETQAIISALKKRFPHIQGPEKGDLCYATTNRQKAVMQLAGQVQLFLIVGAENSSNSNRLVEMAQAQGLPAYLISSLSVLQKQWFVNKSVVGISSGASAPESSVQELISWLRKNYPVTSVREAVVVNEAMHFPLPRELRQPAS